MERPLTSKVIEFDPTDEYHRGEELDAKSYYAAIDRVIALLKGEITDWQSPNPKE